MYVGRELFIYTTKEVFVPANGFNLKSDSRLPRKLVLFASMKAL